MKKLILTTMILAVLFIGGCDYCYHCDDEWWEDDCCDDWTPPSVPWDVYSVTYDSRVEVGWHPVYNHDFSYYKVYRGASETGYYDLIAETSTAHYNDYNVTNGYTYYYAISSVDIYGNESDLSTDLVYDTPRPEGYGLRLWSADLYPADAGIDFSEYLIVPWNSITCDVFLNWDTTGYYYLQAGNLETDIMEYGPTGSLQDVDYAPETGWDPYGWVEIREGYSYVIWTASNHFAHVRVTRIYEEYIALEWSYQTDTGNPELSIGHRSPKTVEEIQIREREYERRSNIAQRSTNNSERSIR